MMASHTKRKDPVSRRVHKDHHDPLVDAKGNIRITKMRDMSKWHPYIRDGDLPTWLEDYLIVHLVHEDSKNPFCHAVHFLYYSLFEDLVDRECMLPSLRMGETIAVFTPDKEKVISAVTFCENQKSVVILFLATASDFENMGMASLLLRLLYQSVRPRLYNPSCNDISVYLLANERCNPTAWAWYKKRGFLAVTGIPSFPSALKDSFSEEGDESPLKNYLARKESLTWLHKQVDAGDFFKKVTLERTMHRLFANPDSTDCPSVYATLPGNLLLHQAHNCKPDYATVSSVLLLDDVFTVADDLDTRRLVLLPGNCHFSVNWTNRCFSLAGNNSFDGEIFDIIIAWLQRFHNAYIWTDCVTIIPISIMRQVSIMHDLFNAYCNAEMVSVDGGPSKELLYYPTIDGQRFMEASIPVMHYIMQNKDLFKKSYIVGLLAISADFSWSCVIAVNAGKVGAKQSHANEPATTCGFLHFDPNGSCTNSLPPPQFSFFLTLAFMVMNCHDDPPNAAKKRRANVAKIPRANAAAVDQIIDPWFQTMEEFSLLMEKAIYNFGFPRRSDIPDSSFVSLAIPKKYLRCSAFCEIGENVSGVKAFIFLLDFCVNKANAPWDGQVAGKLGMGKFLPRTKMTVMRFIQEMQLCIIQIIDRIAETQSGTSRRDAAEYEAYICPLSSEIKMPKANTRYPDFAGKSWIKELHQSWIKKLQGQKTAAKRTNIRNDKVNKVTTKKNKVAMNMLKNAENKVAGFGSANFDEDDVKFDDFVAVYDDVLESEKDTDMMEVQNPNMSSEKTDVPKKAGAMKKGIPLVPLIAQLPTKVNKDMMVMPSLPPSKVKGRTLPQSLPPLRLLSQDRLALIAPLFVTAFKKCSTETTKEEMQWAIFKLLHEQHPIALVADAMSMIVEALAKEEERPAAVSQLGETGVWNGHKPKEYRDRTAMFIDEYESVVDAEAKKKLVERIVLQLREEGFRFLEGKPEEGAVREMSMSAAFTMVNNRMRRLCASKSLDTLDPPDEPPGPFEKPGAEKWPFTALGPFLVDGEPAPNAIVSGQGTESKGNAANAVYRKKISINASEFKRNSDMERKRDITRRVVEEFRNEGYFFLLKEEKAWKLLENTAVVNKVRKSLRESIRDRDRTGKRKAGEMTQSNPNDPDDKVTQRQAESRYEQHND